MDTQMGNTTLGELLPYFIVITILLLFIIFCTKMIGEASKIQKERKQRQAELKAQGVSIYTAFSHVSGLPIAENLSCEIFSYPDKLDFKTGTTKISLQRSKITDMCIRTALEIQNQAVSSVGGAIAGGIMFGPLGAAIGGRTKNKKIKTTSQYLIITYIGEQGELKYIGFDASYNSISAAKLVKEFHELNKNSNVQIEL